MKKNKMLRVAAVMLVLTLLTTSIISGTFANYATSGTNTDGARVATWGVKIAVNGDKAFSNQYTDTTNGVTVSSQASPADKIVAPGTSTAEGKIDGVANTGLHIVATGTAETAFTLTVNMTGVQDIYLEQKNGYDDYTKFTENASGQLVPDGTFNVTDTDGADGAKGYYPIKYTLSGTGVTAVTNGSLADVQAALTSTNTYDPGQSVNIDAYLTWSWDYGATNTQKDTYLGASAAAVANGDPALTGAHTTIAYTLTVSAVQVD